MADAVREERNATQAVERIDSDYAAGAISAGNYERLAAKFGEELVGARAQRERIAQRADDVRAVAAQLDDAMLDAFAALREAIVAPLHDGANVADVPFLLRRLFARFVVHDAGDAGVAVVPEFRPDALEELLATVTATKRAALRLTSDANGLPSTWVVARIVGRTQ